MTTSARRQELKSFLRARRAQLSPADYGLSDYPRRRTPGLRRDEVAQLAQIGITTYTFLEQGRDLTVSSHVLNKLATVFRLNDQEKQVMFRLAKQEQRAVSENESDPVPTLLPMMANADLCAMTVINHRFEVLSQNDAAKLIFGCRGGQANALEHLVNEPSRRSFYENFDYHFRHVVAYARWTYTKYAEDPVLGQFIQRLREKSKQFDDEWSRYKILDHASMNEPLWINHPRLGRLEGSYLLLSVFGYPDSTLCVFSPISTADNDSVGKIAQALAELKAAS